MFFFLAVSDSFWATNDAERVLYRRGFLAGWLAANTDIGLTAQQSKSLSRYEQIRYWLSMEDRASSTDLPASTYEQYLELWELVGKSKAMAQTSVTWRKGSNDPIGEFAAALKKERIWREAF